MAFHFLCMGTQTPVDCLHAPRKKTSQETSDDDQVLEGSKFNISRIANKQSVSSYQINGKITSRQAVFDTLISKGVDLTNSRFLILQVTTHPSPKQSANLRMLQNKTNLATSSSNKNKKGRSRINFFDET